MRILKIILIIPLISQNDQNVFRQDFCDLHEAFQFFRKRFLSDNFIPETHSAPRFFSINKGLGRCSLQLEDIEYEKVNQQKPAIQHIYILFQRQIYSFWWLLILSFLAGWTTGCRLVKKNLGTRGHLLEFQSPWRTIDMDGNSLVWLDNNQNICTQSIADKEFLFKQLTSHLLKKIIIRLFSKAETRLKLNFFLILHTRLNIFI